MALRAIVFLSNHILVSGNWPVGAQQWKKAGLPGLFQNHSQVPEYHRKPAGAVCACQLGKEETQYQETAPCQLILRHYLNEGLFPGAKTGDV